MRKYQMKSIRAFCRAIYRQESATEKLQNFLGQAVLSGVLIFALSSQIAAKTPYAMYILPGLCCWFYLKETLLKSTALVHDFLPFMRGHRYHAFWLSFGIALSNLPTLFIWLVITGIVSIFFQLPFIGYHFLPYIILANFLNAVVQSLTTVALAPLFPKVADTGLAIMLPVFFWTTPIAYIATNLDANGLFFLRLNPLYYLTEGMRSVISGNIPAFEHTLMFFGLMLIMGAVGMTLTKLVGQRALPAI